MMMTDPFQTLLTVQRALDRARTSNWLGATSSSARGAYPPVNVFRQGKHDYLAVVELPGIDRSELDLEVKENAIRLKGRKAIDYGSGASLHRRERLQGEFDRTVTIPVEIDAAKVKAEYRDGMLAVFLPQAEAAKPRTVAIS